MAPLNEPVSFRGSPPSAGITHSLSSARSHDVSLGARYDEGFAFRGPLNALLGRVVVGQRLQLAGRRIDDRDFGVELTVAAVLRR